MSQPLLILFSKAPYQDYTGQEQLDLALLCGASEQSATLLFMDQGVLQLLPQQTPHDRKPYTRAFAVLDDFDLPTPYVAQSSLQRFGLSNTPLCCDIQLIDDATVSRIIQQHSIIFSD